MAFACGHGAIPPAVDAAAECAAGGNHACGEIAQVVETDEEGLLQLRPGEHEQAGLVGRLRTLSQENNETSGNNSSAADSAAVNKTAEAMNTTINSAADAVNGALSGVVDWLKGSFSKPDESTDALKESKALKEASEKLANASEALMKTTVVFDCNAGFENWESGWSDAKKKFCCDKVQKGCEEKKEEKEESEGAKITPFGREDVGTELQKHAAKTQDIMVDAMESAVVAELKRAVFRSLTRLRAAQIKEFDTIARLETQAIDEYNDQHHYIAENPLEHLSSGEQKVSDDKKTSFHK